MAVGNYLREKAKKAFFSENAGSGADTESRFTAWQEERVEVLDADNPAQTSCAGYTDTLELGQPADDCSVADILDFIFDKCVDALIESGDQDIRASFVAETLRRFGAVVSKKEILLAVVAAEWLVQAQNGRENSRGCQCGRKDGATS